MAHILYPIVFVVVGALVFAFSDKARWLGFALFCAGVLVTCQMLARVGLNLPP